MRERPGYGRLTLWGGSRNVFVVSEPPVGLEVALKEVDAELGTLRLDSQDNDAVVPALLLLLTGDQERAERTVSQAYDRLEYRAQTLSSRALIGLNEPACLARPVQAM